MNFKGKEGGEGRGGEGREGGREGWETPHLHKYIQQPQWYYDHSKYRSSNNDNDDGADDTEKGEHKHPKGIGDGFINDVYILREPVEDASKGCGVEERHGGSHDGLEHAVVEGLGGKDGCHSHEHTPKQDEEGLGAAHTSVDTKVTPTAVREIEGGRLV